MTAASYSIVCAVDLGEYSYHVVENALAEALHHDQVVLHMLTVVEDPRDEEDAERRLRDLVAELLPTFADTRSPTARSLYFHARSGEIDEEIVELGIEVRADRIIIGRFGGPHEGNQLGDTASLVVENASCTVQVVRVPSYTEVRADQCPACVQVRAESKGERLFCEKHSEGRIPRLTNHIGSTTVAPGWGIF